MRFAMRGNNRTIAAGPLARIAAVFGLVVSLLVVVPGAASALAITVSFSAASASTAESGDRTVDVVLNTEGATTIGPIVVDIAVDAGASTATEGDDFTFSPAQVIFPLGSGDGASETITLSIVADTDHEPNETAVLNLTVQANADGATAGLDEYTHTIQDNDPAQVTFSSSTSATPESGTHTLTVELAVPGGGDLRSAVTVNVVDDASGDADTPEDYTLNTTSVTFNAGAADGATRNVNVAIAPDAIVEGPETIGLSLSIASGPATASGTHTVTINDNDTAGVDVSPTALSVTEKGTTKTYDVVLTSQPTANVTISAATTTGEATVTPASRMFTPSNWDQAKTFTVEAFDDAVVDGQQSDTIVHTATSNDNAYDEFGVDQVAVTVNDDDIPAVTVSKSSVAVTEGGASATYTVVLQTQPSDDVTITPSDLNGHVNISPPSLTFDSGDWSTPQQFTVTAPNNNLADGTRQDTIEHSATSLGDSDYDGIQVDDVDVTITDDEGPATASINDVSQSETDAGVIIYTFTINISPPAAGATNVRLRTAQALTFPADSSEYENITNRNISIPAQATSVQVDVEAYPDNLVEPDERFLVELFNPGGGLVVGDGSGRATMENDDAAPVGSADGYAVDEGGSLVTTVVTGVLANDSDADDGQGALTAVLVSPPAKHSGTFILNADGSFTYDHNGSSGLTDSFTYRASDGTNVSGVVTVTITVNNVAPVVDAGPDPAPVAEGVSVPINATFFDPGLGDNHTATIDWGDGTVENCPATCSIGFNDQTGNGTVTGSHSFAAVGVYTVTVTVDDGPSTGSDNVTVNVQNANLTVDAGPNQEVDEGSTVFVNASFDDADNAGNHTATIDWGDGTIQNCPAACTIVDNGNGTGTVSGSHVYLDNGAYTVVVAVRDGSGDNGSGGFTANVANVAPTASITGATEADEGDSVPLTGVRTDPGADAFTFSWEVTRDGEFFAAATTKNINLNLNDDGEYLFTFVVTDDDGGVSNVAQHVVSVANVAPTAVITNTQGQALPPSVSGGEEGTLVKLRSNVEDPGLDELTYDWEIRLKGQLVASSDTDRINYKPVEDGAFVVFLRVEDDDGGFATDSVQVVVSNAIPVITEIDFDATPAIGANVGMDVYFTDRGTSDTHIVTVDWGEGGEDGSGGASPRSFSHTYSSAGTRSASVCVTDDDGGEACHDFFVNPGVNFTINSDFDGDGYEDLPIGVPGEDGAGAVAVLYGSAGGVTAAGDDIWKQGTNGIAGVKEGGDSFGSVLAWGDFDLDGYSDLAVSAPLENIDGKGDVGVVHIIYGSSTGLTSNRDTMFHQGTNGVMGSPQPGDRFGDALATGDFNGDGFADLAVGVPFEDLFGVSDTGRIAVFYGSPSGIQFSNDESWHQGSAGVLGFNQVGDQFGAGLAAADFDLDGSWDLVGGMPGKKVNGKNDAGSILVIGGSVLGLDASTDKKFHQSKGSMKNAAEIGDQFGSVLESGDFNGDGRPDLAIGIPREKFPNQPEAGALHVMLSNSNGLSDVGNSFWHENTFNVKGSRKEFDRFGYALAAGDFNNDGNDDLAVGIPYQEVAGKTNAGDVHVFYGGGPKGIKSVGDQRWNEAKKNVRGIADKFDHVGWALRAFDQDGDGDSDLAIGIPDQNVAGNSNAGLVMILRGRTGPINANGESRWHQNFPGIQEVVGQNDRFGWAL